MSTTITTEIPSFPALTLGWREATHGRSFRGLDREADFAVYCTECLADLPSDPDEQMWHLCANLATPERAALVALTRRLADPTPETVRPYGTDQRTGLPLIRWCDVVSYRTKGEAVRAARTIGFSASAVTRATSHLSWAWVITEQCEDGQLILTQRGIDEAAARRAAEHRTRTYTRNHRYVSYNVNSRGMTGWRDQFETIWVCTCGNGGSGNDRDRASAQQAAKQHRDDPAGFPGRPWNHRITVTTTKAS